MIRNPKDMQRYTAHERANHWIVGICFILLALSGLALFHPAFWPLTQLFGGGVWSRTLHPYIGILMTLAFVVMFFRFKSLNAMTPADKEWISRVGEMVDGDDHGMPEQGKYNGGQKMMFWIMALCVLLLIVSGLVLWRSYWVMPVDMVRFSAVIHAAAAAVMIGFIILHVYAAIWVKGTIRAMWYGTVTRAWAKQHHRGWYRQVTGK